MLFEAKATSITSFSTKFTLVQRPRNLPKKNPLPFPVKTLGLDPHGPLASQEAVPSSMAMAPDCPASPGPGTPQFEVHIPTYLGLSQTGGTPQIIHFDRIFHYKLL